MSTAAQPLPLSISDIAAQYGLHRTEVYALITTHDVPTAYIGRARVVAPIDLPRLQKLIRRYRRRKAKSASALS